MLAALPTAAEANHSTYQYPLDRMGWSECSWEKSLVRVATPTATTLQFPGASTSPDKYLARQSFDDRLNASISQWNTWNSTTRGAYTIRRVAPGDSTTWDVLVRYADVGGALGRAKVMRQQDSTYSGSAPYSISDDYLNVCRPISYANDWVLKRGLVDIDRRGEWFTQGDDRRSTWERCDDVGDSPNFGGDTSNAYLCSKLWDVGGVMAHELGHTLVLHHPQSTDYFTSGDGIQAAGVYAECQDYLRLRSDGPFDQATMCAFTYRHHSDSRSLHSWDVETLHYHQSVH